MPSSKYIVVTRLPSFSEWLNFLKALTALNFNVKESRFKLIYQITSTYLPKTSDRQVKDSRGLADQIEMATELVTLENLVTKKFRVLELTDELYQQIIIKAKSNFDLIKPHPYQSKNLARLLRKSRIEDKELLLMLVGELLESLSVKQWKLLTLPQFTELIHYFSTNVYSLLENIQASDLILSWSFSYLDAFLKAESVESDNHSPASQLSSLTKILWSLCTLFKPHQLKPHVGILADLLRPLVEQGEGDIANLSMLA